MLKEFYAVSRQQTIDGQYCHIQYYLIAHVDGPYESPTTGKRYRAVYGNVGLKGFAKCNGIEPMPFTVRKTDLSDNPDTDFVYRRVVVDTEDGTIIDDSKGKFVL